MDNKFDDFRMNIKYYRTKNGLSQAQLAEATSCSNGMIGLIEAGKAKPSFDMILRIADALQVTPADLFIRDISKSKKDITNEIKSEIETFLETIVHS